MSAGGAPRARARKIIAARRGIIVCPRFEDWRPLLGVAHEALGDEEVARCEVCGHEIVTSPSIGEYRAAGWATICTYDAERFRHVLGREARLSEAAEAAREEIRHRFASRHGVPADEIVQVLPPEIAWLQEHLA